MKKIFNNFKYLSNLPVLAVSLVGLLCSISAYAESTLSVPKCDASVILDTDLYNQCKQCISNPVIAFVPKEYANNLERGVKYLDETRWNADKNCDANNGAGHDRTAFKDFFKFNEPLKRRIFRNNRTAMNSDSNGACAFTYVYLKRLFKTTLKNTEEQCNDFFKLAQQNQSCLKVGAKFAECEKGLDAIINRASDKSTREQTQYTELEQAVKELIPARKRKSINQIAENLYKEDLRAFQTKNLPKEKIVTECNLENISCVNGGVDTLDKYLAELTPNNIDENNIREGLDDTKKSLYENNGRLVAEQIEAHQEILSFQKNTAALKAQTPYFANLKTKYNQVRETSKVGSLDESSKIPDMSTVAAAAPLANTFLGGNKQSNPKPPTNFVNGNTDGPGLSGVAPILAAGAALTGASRMKNSSADTGTGGNIPNTASAPDTTAFGEKTVADAGGGGNATNTEATPLEPADEEKENTETTKIESKKEEDQLIASFNNFGLTGQGASRQTNLNRNNKTEATEAANEKGLSGNEIFNQNNPGSTTKGSKKEKSSGNDIAGLMSQMKNLFSFDDTGGANFTETNMDMFQPGGGFDGSSASRSPSGTDPFSDDNFTEDADMAFSGDTESYSHEEEALASFQSGDHKSIKGNPLRADGESLFARVHSRHQLAIKKGLVLAKLPEVL
ncbi:MAG: hypothetical protein M9962_03165 [Oligoflexia bacterium]|nr:hypothetical protein [Oligoflexia bacterium]